MARSKRDEAAIREMDAKVQALARCSSPAAVAALIRGGKPEDYCQACGKTLAAGVCPRCAPADNQAPKG